MESLGQEGNLTLIGWLSIAAVIVGVVALLYVWNKKQIQECERLRQQQEEQRKRELGLGPGSEWQQ